MARSVTLHMNIPDDAGPASEASTQERRDWLERMHAQLAQHEKVGYFEAQFSTSDGTLFMDASRHGSAISVVWGAGEPPGIAVATSLFLQGVDGADDNAALRTFQEGAMLRDASQQMFTKIQAQNRPCVNISWVDREWYENGHVIAAAMALAAAIMTGPGANARFEPQRMPSEAEVAAQRKEVEDIMEVFGIIQRDWATRRTLQYLVKPSAPVKGRTYEEVKDVKFWTGANGEGRTLSLVGLINTFLMLKDYIEQAPGLGHLRQPTTKHKIDFALDPPVLLRLLEQISLDEPGPRDT